MARQDQTSDERQDTGEGDINRCETLTAELLDRFTNPDTQQALPGLVVQAWNLPLGMLLTKQPQTADGGHTGKPGSRTPCRTDTWSHVQKLLDWAREEADELGCYTNGQDGEKALQRLPALLWPTLDDCLACQACNCPYDPVSRRCTVCREHGKPVRHRCVCRHRKIAKALGWYHGELLTALQYQEPRSDRPDIICPECGRRGKVSVRRDKERIWCRFEDCDWQRVGTFAILAEAS